MKQVDISHQPVELYKILKFEGLVSSGAEAKTAIDNGLVTVNGDIETRRRKKMLHGDIVGFDSTDFQLRLQEASH